MAKLDTDPYGKPAIGTCDENILQPLPAQSQRPLHPDPRIGVVADGSDSSAGRPGAEGLQRPGHGPLVGTVHRHRVVGQGPAIPSSESRDPVGRSSEVGQNLPPSVVNRNRKFVGMAVPAAVGTVFQHDGPPSAAQYPDPEIPEHEAPGQRRLAAECRAVGIEERLVRIPGNLAVTAFQHVEQQGVAVMRIGQFIQPHLRREGFAVPAVVMGRKHQVGIGSLRGRGEHTEQLAVEKVDPPAAQRPGREQHGPQRVVMIGGRPFVPPAVGVNACLHQAAVSAFGIVQRHVDQRIVAQRHPQSDEAAVMPYLPVAAAAPFEQHIGAHAQVAALDRSGLPVGHNRPRDRISPGRIAGPDRFVEALAEHPSAVERGGPAVGVVFEIGRVLRSVVEQHVADVLRIFPLSGRQVQIGRTDEIVEVPGVQHVDPRPVAAFVPRDAIPAQAAIVGRGPIPVESEHHVVAGTEIVVQMAPFEQGNRQWVFPAPFDDSGQRVENRPTPRRRRRSADRRPVRVAEKPEPVACN